MLLYQGNIVVIKQAIVEVTKVFESDSALRRCVFAQDHYEYSTASIDMLFHIMGDYWVSHQTEVLTFKKWNPWSKVLAYSVDDKHIYINRGKLNRSVASVAGTLAHELVHCADNACKPYTFGHGDNYSHGKETTFPYSFGNEVQKMVLSSK